MRERYRQAVKLTIMPISFKEACAFIALHHRHHPPPSGHKFAVAVSDGEKIVGVATIGRPIARHLDDGFTAEVTRVATDSTRNACSMLYGAARRAAKALGFRLLITYTLASENGGSLRASGWRCVAETAGNSWDRPRRRRKTRHPTGPKKRWECRLG
jgi:hypothetical protein